MSRLSKKYYIPQVKRLLKSISKKCVVCQRTYARTSTQIMTDLPANRTNPSSPFSCVGIDYAGLLSFIQTGKSKKTYNK